MRVIHKHVLCGLDEADHSFSKCIIMEYGASIMHVGVQDNNICIWEYHDDHNNFKVPRVFIILGTGRGFINYIVPLGTVIDNPYVWHVCEDRSA